MDKPQIGSKRISRRRNNKRRGRLIRRTKGDTNTKLHAVCDSKGRPLNLFVTACRAHQIWIGVLVIAGTTPIDSEKRCKITGSAPAPGRKQQQTTARYEKHRDNQRNHIEIMFGRLKDWRRVTNNYDRCPNVFFSPIALAATVTYFCNSMHPEPRPIGSISGCQRDARHAPITMSPP